MAWTYADWRSQTTPAARRARLALHMDEVAQLVGPSVSSEGHSIDSNGMVAYLEFLEARYEAMGAAAAVNAGACYARIRTP